MRRIFNDWQQAPQRALQVSFHSLAWKLLLILPCFAATIEVSGATAQNLTPRDLRSREPAGILHTKPAAMALPLENQMESVTQEPSLPASDVGQTAPNQPQVFYENGLLEILAENSVLSDILAAVRERTGADIELPASAAGERIYARIGPGPARKVLGALLSLTDLDFVIQAPEMDPQGIQRVLFTPRLKAAGVGVNGRMDASTAQSARTPARRMPRSIPGRGEPVEPDNPGTAVPELASSEPTSPPAQQTPPSDPQAASNDVQATTTASDSDSNKPAAKTSEQMMQDLQNLYQLRRQQMQQLQQSQQSRKP